MYTFDILDTGCVYLVKEKETDPLQIVRIHFKTDYAVCFSLYSRGEKVIWKKKTDPLFDIIELLDDEAIANWEKLFFNEDAFYSGEDEE
jgi:hypothetical protein